MPNQRSLDTVFRALADPTRRAVIERLVQGPATVSELAAPASMALPSFLQHLAVLESSGLVRSDKAGRVRTVRLETKTLARAEDWMSTQRRLWTSRLEQLDAYVKALDREERSASRVAPATPRAARCARSHHRKDEKA
jgi:DNA-binding transcriptional ArsR family regulator